MEINDITNIVALKQTSLKALPRVNPGRPREDVSQEPELNSSSDIKKAEAALINADQLVQEISNQAESLGTYVKSLSGVIDQGVKENSEVRRTALAKEANQIIKAIEDRVVNIKVSDSKVSTEDPLRSEVEAKIGRTLDLLFPEKGEGKVGNTEISFSNKELIISVQTKILKTTHYLDSLRKSDKGEDFISKAILIKAETAQLNAESARSTLRDVDRAFNLANEANREISNDPKTALVAVGSVRREQLDVEG